MEAVRRIVFRIFFLSVSKNNSVLTTPLIDHLRRMRLLTVRNNRNMKSLRSSPNAKAVYKNNINC